jgi:phosphoribosylanthranilate isomerase
LRSFKIKICGITNPSDALGAVKAGADAIGLNFYERSLRSVTPLDALEIVARLPEELVVVGVFVNALAEEISELESHLRLGAIQLHGDENPEILSQLDSQAVIRAVRIAGNTPAEIAAAQQEIDAWCEAGVAAILLDKASGRAYGGSGQCFDWKIARKLNIPVPLILAGGLGPENVADAIAMVVPDAVDAASGVEAFPGGKDPGLMKRFVASSREAFERLSS